jgi:hypothetical protein
MTCHGSLDTTCPRCGYDRADVEHAQRCHGFVSVSSLQEELRFVQLLRRTNQGRGNLHVTVARPGHPDETIVRTEAEVDTHLHGQEAALEREIERLRQRWQGGRVGSPLDTPTPPPSAPRDQDGLGGTSGETRATAASAEQEVAHV